MSEARRKLAEMREVGFMKKRCTCKMGLLPCPKHGWVKA